jgi:nitrate reductase NapE component
MQGNSVTNQQQNLSGQVSGGLGNQSNGINPSVNTNYINNISAVAANNRQANINNMTQNSSNVSNNANYQNLNYSQGYVEPPKKKSSLLTFILIFLILAVAAVGGYFVGGYVYDATHQTTTE